MQIRRLPWVRSFRFAHKGGAPLALLLVLAGLLVAAPVAPTAYAADLGFAAPVFLSDGIKAASVVEGDLNGDGALDIVLGYGSSGQGMNQIYLNDGRGQFAAPTFLPTLGPTYSMALGDLNGDGALDIVLAGTGDRPTQVLFNGGQAHFATPVGLADSGGFLDSVALGDLNGDGAIDIALGGGGGKLCKLFINDGRGGFGSPIPILNSQMDLTMFVSLGDLNGDGAIDLVISYTSYPSQIFLNDGRANFTAAAALSDAPQTVSGNALGDLDGDGDLDMVVARTSQPSVILMNDGQANFGSPILLPKDGNFDAFVYLGDLNGDGALDIVLGDGNNTRVLLNNGSGGFAAPSLVRENGTSTSDVGLGDLNGDGALDLVLSDRVESNQVLLSNGPASFAPPVVLTDNNALFITAPADMNGDGALDLIIDSVNQFPPLIHSSRVYLNNGQPGFAAPLVLPGSRDTTDMAVGDLNNDGLLDIVFSSGVYRIGPLDDSLSRPSQVLLNLGQGNFANPVDLPESRNGFSVAVGDLNADGALDIVLGRSTDRSQIYFNDGQGHFNSFVPLSTHGRTISDVALGDLDSDGALDIVLSAENFFSPFLPIQIYHNDGQGHFGTPVVVSAGVSSAIRVMLGDLNGDGALDMIANIDNANKIYLNDGRGNFSRSNVLPGASGTIYLALGDLNGDGALDIVTSYHEPWIFFNRNDGTGSFLTPIQLTSISTYAGLSVGDLDGDGALDIVAGKQIYFNHLATPNRLPNLPPTVAIHRPGPTPDADFYSTPALLTDRTIPINYSLSDPEGDRVGAIRGSYSLDGGGTWHPAIAATGTITSNLVAAASGTNYVFNWDTFASGAFGQSDNAVFRIEAYPTPLANATQPPGTYTYPRAVTNLYQHPFAAATTFPFRLRGTRIRVTQNGVPQPNALVYRLAAGENLGGSLIGGTAHPFTTDAQGFLRGIGELQLDDRLLALAPISSTATYSMYATNGTPTEIGVDSFSVTDAGVQNLEVSASKPLMLFDLHVALEWDASSSPTYLQQLQFNLQRASEYLYDFTNGQVALRSITVHQNADDWATSDVVIHATNRLRPFAAQGGIVLTPTVDPEHSDIIYDTGQVHMGAVWNRYGTPGQDLGGDWSIALAHELSHYLLFQDDAYLGIGPDGLLRPIDTCGGSAMGDLYTNPDNTEFVADQAYWNANCAQTLGAQTLGRTEWQTIKTWYPQLNVPTAINPGPGTMPFNFTSISIQPPITPTLALADPTFYLDYAAGQVSSNEAHAFLLRANSYVIDLGNPTGGQNRLLANGAQPGDRICVFDRARQQYGCEPVALGDDRIALEQDPNWTPVLQLTPVTSTTFNLAVAGLPPGLPLKARLFPEYGSGGPDVGLVRSGTVYSGTFELGEPTLAGNIQVWVDETATEDNPRRETIVAYTLGGNPGNTRGGGGNTRGGGGNTRGGGAPLVSADGQMIFFTPNPIVFQEGQFYTIQSMAGLPPLPPGKTVIGQGYNLVATAGTPVITGSVSFQYLGNDVLVAGADENQLTIHFWNGAIWQALPTIRSTYFNVATTRSQGPGIYALMAGTTVPQITSLAPQLATNDHATTLTVNGGGFLPPVQVALVGARNTYTLPVTSVFSTSVTAVITAGLQADEYQVVITNGDGGRASAPGAFSLFAPSPARFYDFFESGSAKWQLNGEWAIAVLPDGNRAMTDNPSGPYYNAIPPATRRRTSITSEPFSLDGLANPVLSFRHDFVLARVGSSEDIGRVQISTDNGATWATLARYSGGGIFPGAARLQLVAAPEWTSISWKQVTIRLRGYSGNARLRFELDVDQGASDKGWVIDDVRVESRAAQVAETPQQQLFFPLIVR